jgi:hypothetical protein
MKPYGFAETFELATALTTGSVLDSLNIFTTDAGQEIDPAQI